MNGRKASAGGRGTVGGHRARLRRIGVAAWLAAAAMPAPLNAQISGVPQGSPIPHMLPVVPPSVETDGPTLALPAPSAEVPNQPVRVTSVAVEGVTAYPKAVIAELAAGLVGSATPLPQVDAARLAILARYRADGYVLSTVSVNLDVTGGRLRFIVTEGRIASVKLDGDIGPAGAQVRRFLNRLTETQPIDAATLERYLLLAQDVPGVTLHAVLQPSAAEPGALTLVAQVSRQAVSGLATVDNRAYVHTGPIEALGITDLNSFTEYGEVTEAEIYHAFPNSETFGQVAVETFLGASGLKLRIDAGAGTTTPTGPLGALDYLGKTTLFGGLLSYPLIRARQQMLNLHLALDGTQSTVDLGNPPIVSSDESLRILRFSGDDTLSDLLLGADRSAVNAASARISHGLPILGATPSNAAIAPRLGEHTDFTKFDFQLSRTQTLFSPWPGATVALMGLLGGQVSRDVLPLSEEFYLGGLQFTRGYYSGEVTGDDALVATAELQLNAALDLGRLHLPMRLPAQYYLFYDRGQTWNSQAADPDVRLGSAGGGMRIELTARAELDLEGLVRFNRYPTGTGTGVSPLYGGAFYWRVLVRY